MLYRHISNLLGKFGLKISTNRILRLQYSSVTRRGNQSVTHDQITKCQEIYGNSLRTPVPLKNILIWLAEGALIITLLTNTPVHAQAKSKRAIARQKQQNGLGGLTQKSKIVDEDDQNPLHQLALKLNIPAPEIPFDFEANKKKIENPEQILNQKGLKLVQNVWITRTEEQLSDKIAPLQMQINALEVEMSNLNANYIACMNQLAEANSNISSLRSYAQRCQANKLSLRNRISSLISQIKGWQSTLRNQSNLSSSSINTLEKNIDNAFEQINQAESNIISLDTELLNISAKLQEAISVASELQSRIRSIQAEYRVRESEYNNTTVALASILTSINKSYTPLYADGECINSLYQYNKDLAQWTSIGPFYFAVDNLKFLALNVLKPLPIEPQRAGSKSFEFKTDNLITRQISGLEIRKKTLDLNNQLANNQFDDDVAKFRKDWNDRMSAYETANQDPFVRGALREMTRIKRVKYEIAPSRAFTKLIDKANSF